MPPSREAHLRNEDFTDRELLHIINDCSTDGGWARTAEIADQLGLVGDNPGRAVASRMTWMVNYGFCERHKEEPGTYRLTKDGRALMGGRLTKGASSLLDKLDDGTRILIMREITTTSMLQGSAAAGAMMRREYLNKEAAWKSSRSNGRGRRRRAA